MQMKQREQDAYGVNANPQSVENVVAKRAVYERAARSIGHHFGASCQRSAEKCGPQVDGDAGEPNHKGTEEHALRRVHEQGTGGEILVVSVLREDGRIVEQGGERIDGRDSYQQQEGRLH